MLTGKGGPVAWNVIDDPTAPAGAKVLAQTSKDTTDNRFPLAVFDQPALQDLDVAVRFKPVFGRGRPRRRHRSSPGRPRTITTSCAPTRWRTMCASIGWSKATATSSPARTSRCPSGVWQELRLVVRGTRFEVFFEGRSLYVATDAVFATAGRVALWTKADGVTSFDDLQIGGL